MKPKVIAILPSFIPSTTIDVITPLIDLHNRGLIDAKITLEVFVSKRDIEWSDIAILCRNTEPLSSHWFSIILQQNKPYIYDIDDNLFELSTDTRDGRYHKDAQRLMLLTEYIRYASLVRVYSDPMLECIQSINTNVNKINAPIDLRLITPIRENKNNNHIKIVYTTSRTDDRLSEIFKPALIQLLELYPQQIQVFFLGFNPPEFKHIPNVFFKPTIYDYSKYLRTFSSAGYDIGLAPLQNDLFHRSKTNNKFREYGASHIAGVYSNIDVYSTCVSNNETGLLVENNKADWFDAMRLLIEKSELRKHIQNQAFKFVRHNYNQEVFVEFWYREILSCIDQNKKRMIESEYLLELHDYRRTKIQEVNQVSGSIKCGVIEKGNRIVKIFQNMLADLKNIGLTFTINKICNYFCIIWIYEKIQILLKITRAKKKISNFLFR